MESSEATHSPWMGKDEAQLSLGAVLFLLPVLVFPVCWLSFWPCITFTDGLCRGGLGKKKDLSRNPLKAHTALQSTAAST